MNKFDVVVLMCDGECLINKSFEINTSFEDYPMKIISKQIFLGVNTTVSKLYFLNSSEDNSDCLYDVIPWKEECTKIYMKDYHLMVVHCMKKSDMLFEVAYVIGHFMDMYYVIMCVEIVILYNHQCDMINLSIYSCGV